MGRAARLAIERRLDDALSEIFTFRSDARLLQLFADDHVLHAALGIGPVSGVEPLRARLRSMWRAFGASAYQLQQVVAEGDQAYARVAVQVKHTAPFRVDGTEMSVTARWLVFALKVFTRWRGPRLAETWIEGDFFQTLLGADALHVAGLDALIATRDERGPD
ncbi:MAG: nuclear transport factor 2 family protein [Polyangiaceae bacterium]